MKLDFRKPAVSVPLHLHPQKWSNSSNISTANQEWQASTWVKLQEPPSPYSHDEALLLCQHSDTEWIVWIPEYGEMLLHRNQFDQAC
jgi:hypothetical protein